MHIREQVLVGLMSIAYVLSLTYVGGPSNAALIAASVLLVAGCCVKFLPLLSGRAFRWSHIFTVMLAYVVWLTVLVYTSTLAENSIHIAWLLLGFPLVVWLASDLDEQSWFFALLLFSFTGVVSALWGLSGFVMTLIRGHGPIIDANAWCAIMNLFFFAMVYTLLCREEKWIRVAATAGLALFALSSFSAYSRVGTVVIVAAVALVVILAARYRHLWGRLAIIVAIVAASYGVIHGYAGPLRGAGGANYTLDMHDAGWSTRIAMWRSGLKIYEEYPVFGSGLGTFKTQYPKFRTHGDLTTAGDYVHNDYLQYLLEGGPLLLLFLLTFVGLLVVRLVPSGVRLVKGDETALAPVVLTVGMGTLFLESLMNFPMYQMQTQMMMGLLFARYIKVSGLGFPVQFKVSSPRLLQSGVVIGAVLVCLVPVLDAVSAQLTFNGKAIPMVNRLTQYPKAYVTTMSMFAHIRSVDPYNRFEMATIYRSAMDQLTNPNARRSLAIASAHEYQAGLALNPYHDKVRLYFARLLAENPWLSEQKGINETPESLYKKGIEVYPVYIESYQRFAAYLRTQGKADEAYALLAHKALPWANLRHGTFSPARLKLFETLLSEAKARGDQATLHAILALM